MRKLSPTLRLSTNIAGLHCRKRATATPAYAVLGSQSSRSYQCCRQGASKFATFSLTQLEPPPYIERKQLVAFFRTSVPMLQRSALPGLFLVACAFVLVTSDDVAASCGDYVLVGANPQHAKLMSHAAGTDRESSPCARGDCRNQLPALPVPIPKDLPTESYESAMAVGNTQIRSPADKLVVAHARQFLAGTGYWQRVERPPRV